MKSDIFRLIFEGRLSFSLYNHIFSVLCLEANGLISKYRSDMEHKLILEGNFLCEVENRVFKNARRACYALFKGKFY